MKQFIKGFSIQLSINLIAHLIRIGIAYLIIKYAPEPLYPTSFAKDTGWQLISLFSIIVYNIISLIVSLIVSFVRYRKNDIKLFVGWGMISILGIIYAMKFCGL